MGRSLLVRKSSAELRHSRVSKKAIEVFRKAVWSYYRRHGRHDLPWRLDLSGYSIVVSELMLQQTQVERVRGYFIRFLKQFSSWEALANANLAEVLTLWVGLGYNRRARFLWTLAKTVHENHQGALPLEEELLLELPGIGPYTAAAVLAFAGDKQSVLIETNIRAAVITHFFKNQAAISDEAVRAVLTQALPKHNFRKWHWALMDYGAFIKKKYPGIGRKSKTHVKQSKFSGSLREMRGRIVRSLVKQGQLTERGLERVCAGEADLRFKVALKKLLEEGLVVRKGEKLLLQ